MCFTTFYIFGFLTISSICISSEFNNTSKLDHKSEKLISGSNSEHLLCKSVKFYQRYFSSIFGGHCSLNPTCSNYSLIAFKEHGALLGFLLTYDRLIHETDEPKFSYKIIVNEKIRFHDPLKNNDLWFKKRKQEPFRRLILNVENIDR